MCVSVCLCACVYVCVCLCACVCGRACAHIHVLVVNQQSECLCVNGEVNRNHLSKTKSPCGKGGLKPVLGRQGK